MASARWWCWAAAAGKRRHHASYLGSRLPVEPCAVFPEPCTVDGLAAVQQHLVDLHDGRGLGRACALAQLDQKAFGRGNATAAVDAQEDFQAGEQEHHAQALIPLRVARRLDPVNAHLARKGLLLRKGSIVEATTIEVPSSTKNAQGTRDPEMRQTKKSHLWHFGMKAHIAMHPHSGLMHMVTKTAAG